MAETPERLTERDLLKLPLKPQNVRLVDIWILGPAILMSGITGKSGPVLRLFFIIAGATTIFYNLENYRKWKRIIEERIG